MGSAEQERAGFSLRLNQALREAGWKKLSTIRLTRAFNSIAGNSSVTIHAVRKWVIGESIPTQVSLILLANMLNVTAEWLRFGSGVEQNAVPPFNTQDSVLLADVSKLSDAHKQMAREMMKILIRVGRK